MKAITMAMALALGWAGGAIAADAVGEDLAVVGQPYDWSGLHVGGQVGYGLDGNADYTFGFFGTMYDYSHDPDGLMGGLYVGYDHQFANGIVLGAEADIVWGNLKDTGLAPGDSDFDATTEMDWMGSARARLGYAIDRFLPYLTGGAAFSRISFEERLYGRFYSDGNVDLTGWTVGAGGEYALTDNWIVRGEYRYTKFDDRDLVTQPENETYGVDFSIHDVRIGAAYKF